MTHYNDETQQIEYSEDTEQGVLRTAGQVVGMIITFSLMVLVIIVVAMGIALIAIYAGTEILLGAE